MHSTASVYRTLIICIIGFFSVSACGSQETESLGVQQFDASVMRGDRNTLSLTWDDLLPQGEERIIARLQNEYLADLSLKLSRLHPQTLAEAGRANNFAGVEEGSALDFMPQLGTFNVVEDLHETQVRVPGFVVPLQSDDINLYTEFLLAPYFGACIHLPPPPPNQIIYVRSTVPVRIADLQKAYFVKGELRGERIDSDLGNAAYTLSLDEIMHYSE